jgi:GNAT superfamily N-acetyltransferase
MYRKFATLQLKSGETMELGVVLAPEPPLKDKIAALLQHKGGVWNWHVERCMVEKLDELETRFHIGLLGDAPIANVMTLEYKGVGILGHVFTRPEHRRKGACQAIMVEVMKNFKERGGRLLHLGTGFNSPPYWIYHSFGFRGLADGSGHMRYEAVPNVERDLFAPSPAKVVDVLWRHWPMMPALTSTKEGDYLRNLSYQHFGFANFEGPFVDMKRSLETDPAHFRCKLLETPAGVVAGYAMVRPNPHWRGAVNVVEFFVHPNFSDHGAELLRALPLPPGKAQCFADSASAQKMAALKECGFEREAILKGQIALGSERLDVYVYSKWTG